MHQEASPIGHLHLWLPNFVHVSYSIKLFALFYFYHKQTIKDESTLIEKLYHHSRMTAERLAGLDSYFSGEDILGGGKESFYDTFLSKMKLKHVSVEARRRWIAIGSILYALYCASGLLWTSVIQDEPHRQREIQVFFFRTHYYSAIHLLFMCLIIKTTKCP